MVATGVPKKFMTDTAEARVPRMLDLAKAADEVVLAENLATIFLSVRPFGGNRDRNLPQII